MAITTATIDITSTDLGISLNASTNLSKTGTSTGLEIMDAGYGEVTVAHSGKALLEASAVSGDRDTSNYFYLSNKATDETYYLIVKLHDTIVGRLSAGDWMFMPWSQGDDAAEISVTATNGTCAYEYAVFKSAYTLVDRTA
tara:strand:- start:1492 stop:1914 length:423 start_codon:yes stop_codon:yes gene_type:complete